MSATPVRVVHADDLGLDFGAEHPNDRRRHQLAVALSRDAGLFDGHARLVPAPPALSDDELCRVLAPEFVAAMRRYSDDPASAVGDEASRWGIDGDNGAFAGMHEASARLCAASVAGARAITSGEAVRAFVPTGGIHHSLANRASGFGIYSDTALAIAALLDGGAPRVVYVDVDAHHGNGIQWIFYADPRVLTISIHESGRFLFPGSGFADETGDPRAPGSAANVAMPPGADDAAYRDAFERLVIPLVRAFDPAVLVTQCGVDTHHADPLSHLAVTMAGYDWMWQALAALTEEVCGARWLALGGGGYAPCSVPPRAWTLLLAAQAGVTLPDAIPEAWRERSLAAGCPAPPRALRADTPPPQEPGARDAARAAVSESVAALRRFWPI